MEMENGGMEWKRVEQRKESKERERRALLWKLSGNPCWREGCSLHIQLFIGAPNGWLSLPVAIPTLPAFSLPLPVVVLVYGLARSACVVGGGRRTGSEV